MYMAVNKFERQFRLSSSFIDQCVSISHIFQLILGNFGLSYEQERVQMGMWAIMAAPLMISADLRTLRNTSRDLLLNRHVIRINQDPMGIQGRRVQMVSKSQ